MPKLVFSLPAAQQSRSRATTARFIAAAGRLLETQPWEEISVERLTEEAELSTGAFYKRFRSKDDVLAAIVEQALAEGQMHTQRLLAVKGGLKDRVTSLVQLSSEGWRLRDTAVRAAKAIRDPRHLKSLRVQSAQTQAMITEWLLERRVEFRHPSPETAIASAFALTLFALQTALTSSQWDPDQRDRFVREAAAMLTAYFMAPPGSFESYRVG